MKFEETIDMMGDGIDTVMRKGWLLRRAASGGRYET